MIRKNLSRSPHGIARTLGQSCVIALLAISSQAAFPQATLDISASTLQSIADSDLVLVGPVEAVNRLDGVLRILGQQVRTAAGASIDRRITTGAVVSIRGNVAGDGFVDAQFVGLATDRYVAGATPVLIRGRVTSVNAAFGTLRIGKLLVDYTSSLHSLDASSVQVGALVLMAGIQPRVGSIFLAQATLAGVSGGASLNRAGIGGSDLQGIGGSDLSGIGGSDLQGIGGSDYR